LSRQFVWPVRVYYEDTDVGGVVYYANYLKFMERARTEWLRSLGFEQDRLIAERGLLFAVTHAEVEYRRPARFNDMLAVSVSILSHRRASMTFAQQIRRDTMEGEVLCQGTVTAACLDAQSFTPRPMPAAILAEMS
jgi:acyl-CoA thioester hydrolase